MNISDLNKLIIFLSANINLNPMTNEYILFPEREFQQVSFCPWAKETFSCFHQHHISFIFFWQLSSKPKNVILMYLWDVLKQQLLLDLLSRIHYHIHHFSYFNRKSFLRSSFHFSSLTLAHYWIIDIMVGSAFKCKRTL